MKNYGDDKNQPVPPPPPPPVQNCSKIEMVSVSVGYSDFLAQTLLFNKGVFDRTLIITDTKDIETQKICDFHSVECFKTDIFYKDGAAFNKGAAVDEALKYLDFSDWCLHLDSDIALSTTAHHRLRNIPLHSDVIYGADRLMVPSYKSWASFIAKPTKQHYDGSVWPIPFRSGYRYVDNFRYLPIGYFQLFNRNAKAFSDYENFYPTEFTNAAQSDLMFGRRWESYNRQLIEEIYVYHLEEEENGENIGVNWEGRKSLYFGPT